MWACEGSKRVGGQSEFQSESEKDFRIKRFLDVVYPIDPCLGSGRLVNALDREHDLKINREPCNVFGGKWAKRRYGADLEQR